MKHPMAVIGLALFLVVDVVLFLAVRQHMGDAPPVSISDGVASSAPSSQSPAASASAEPEAAGAPGLELSRSGLLAKVSRGRCTSGSRPLIQISTDQGATFTEVALPLLEKADTTTVGAAVATVRTIDHVRAASADEIVLIGSDADCRPRQFTTSDGGDSWKQSKPKTPSDPLDAWRVDAAGTGVMSSAGATEPGCDVVALAPVSDRNAKVACSDGTIEGTNDFGSQWVQLGVLDQISGLTFATVADGFAIAPEGGCDVRLLTTGDAGGRWEPAGCIAKKGEGITLVGSTPRLYALVDDQVFVSTDAGKGWTPASAGG